MLKRIASLGVLALLGCSFSGVVTVPNLSDSQGKVIAVDARPEREKTSEIFSLVAGNPAYGVQRFGDDRLTPSPVRLLQHRVYEKLYKNKSINLKVHHLVGYFNSSKWGLSVASGATYGATGGWISTTYPVLNDSPIVNEEEYKRGLYSVSENPNADIVLIVFVDAEIDGERFAIRHIHLTGNSRKAGTNYIVDATEEAINKFIAHYNPQ